jgi:hypothetical protein
MIMASLEGGKRLQGRHDHGVREGSRAPGSSCRGDARLAQGWNAVWSQVGSALTARNAAGLQGTNSGRLVPPSDWRLGGAPCAQIT